MERSEAEERPARELYALLHLSPEASDEDLKRAYRHWAQVYHPDKHQTAQMRDIATENFQRIREAYEILSNERRRQIYDIYGMEGLTSGLELGPKLKSRAEVKAEFERLQQGQRERRLAAHVHQQGSLLMNLTLVQFFKSCKSPNINGMAMSTQVQAHVSQRDTLVLGGSMALRRGLGGGSVTVVLRRQVSPRSALELLAVVGLRSVLSLQTSRQLLSHTTGTLGLSLALKDSSLTLVNIWTRQLTEDITGNIQLLVGPETGILVGWQKNGKVNAGSVDVKVGAITVGISGQYNHHFSSKSQGRLTGKIGSTGVEIEVGCERRLSAHSSAAMFCGLGFQGVSWKIRFNRGGQKFVIPMTLCTASNPVIAIGALLFPPTVYLILKNYIIKPHNLWRRRQKSHELLRIMYQQVRDARAASENLQLLLKNVAERKKLKQVQSQGLVILAAIYGDIEAYEKGVYGIQHTAQSAGNGIANLPPYLDVTIPLQFLVDESGQLRLHEGVKKVGLMGFCDPCPGELKQLKILYSFLGQQYEVKVGDYDQLWLPQEGNRI